MSKLKEQLRAMGIFNNYELTRVYGVTGSDVWVEYERPLSAFSPKGTRVYSHSNRLDPDHHYTIFAAAKCFPGKRNATMPLAMAWAAEHYAVEDWAPSPFRGRVPRYIRRAAEAAVKKGKAGQ